MKKPYGRAVRQKGHNWERVVARMLGVAVRAECKRGLGQARATGEVADVDGVAGLWIECKVGARTNPRAALAQATCATLDHEVRTRKVSIMVAADTAAMPIAVCKDDRKQPFVCMYLPDFLAILSAGAHFAITYDTFIAQVPAERERIRLANREDTDAA